MASKVIYFSVGQRLEQAEFYVDANPEEVKGCFRAAAEAGPYDILKLYNCKGNLVNISPCLEENSPDTRYKLEVVAAHCGHCGKDLHGLDVEAIEIRLQRLEKHVFVEDGSLPSELKELRERVDGFKAKLENVEHLSWLGLFKEMHVAKTALPTSSLGAPNLRKTDEQYLKVLECFTKMGSGLPSQEVINNLRRPSFDNWQWEDAEMMFLVQQMFVDLGLVEHFHIETPVLQQFVFEVYRHYNQVPFHNFRHCFCVTQMMYGMIWLSEVHKMIGAEDILIMLVSAFCHDLDHPGYNNVYQVNARTELAIRYNDISPLENHHAAVCFDILTQPRCNILANLKPDVYKKVREGIIHSILATDMARHRDILDKFEKIISDGFDWKSTEHKHYLMLIFIKAADVSNEARPMEVAEPWLECLLQEFFNQSDVEKLEGLPTAPFMDREKVTKSSAQIGFIKFVLIPLIHALTQLFPVFQDYLLNPILTAYNYYSELGRQVEEEKSRKQAEKHRKISEDIEKRLSIEITRKLSREFEQKLQEKLAQKYGEDMERKSTVDRSCENGPGSPDLSARNPEAGDRTENLENVEHASGHADSQDCPVASVGPLHAAGHHADPHAADRCSGHRPPSGPKLGRDERAPQTCRERQCLANKRSARKECRASENCASLNAVHVGDPP